LLHSYFFWFLVLIYANNGILLEK